MLIGLRVTGLVAILTCVALAAGCKATDKSIERKETAVASLQTVRGEITRADKQIDTTLLAMRDLEKTDSKDSLKRRFDRYVNALSRLQSDVKQLNDRTNDLDKRAATYLSAWEQETSQISNVKLQEIATKRRTSVQSSLNRFRAEMDATRAAYRPLLSELLDIQTFLASELTPGSVKAASDVFHKAEEDAGLVHQRVQQVLTELDGLITALSQSPAPKS